MVNHGKKIFSFVGYNAAEIFLIFELKYFHENQFFSKMILTHESEAQEDQFDGKKRRPKISWYYPFKRSYKERQPVVFMESHQRRINKSRMAEVTP